MSESSWLNIYEGGEEDDGAINLNKNGQVGDWSSFMIAMDDEGGQELGRSLSQMKLNDASDKSKFKLSGGMERPSAPDKKVSPTSSKRSSLGMPMPGSPGHHPHHHQYQVVGVGRNRFSGSAPLMEQYAASEQHSGGNTPPYPLSSSPITTKSSPIVNATSFNSSSPPLSSSPSSASDLSIFNFFRKKKVDQGVPKIRSMPGLTIDTLDLPATKETSEGSTTPRTPHLADALEDIQTQLAQQQTEKVMEGWMERASSRSSWKKHWYVLRGNHLEYFNGWWEDKPAMPHSPRGGDKEKSDTGVKENRITLNYWYTLTKPVIEEGKYVFVINPFSEVERGDKKIKLLKFRCEDEASAKKWCTDIEQVIKKKKETTVTLRPLVSEHKMPGGRRATVTNYVPPSPTSPKQTVFIPRELIDDLEPDEKKVLETVKSLLDEFAPAPLPPDVKPSEYRNRPRSNDGFYRIMSLDGGGLRSVMVCVLIERITKRFPTFLDYVDVFTGTSAGSIVAAGLAAQYPPKGTRRVLELTALPVFGKKRAGFNMNNSKYFNRLLRASCYVFFQDKRFYEFPRKLVVPAFQLDSHYPPQAEPYAPKDRRWMPAVFHNIGKCDDWLTQEVVSDALLRSGAAPTFFPSYQGFIDGGVFCNNPGMAAMSLAMSPKNDNIPANKIICLSLGTGLSPHYMEGGPDYDYGLLNWAPKLGNLFMGSQVDFLAQLCDNILGERYHRINPLLGVHTSMDDPKLVSELATLANEVDLQPTFNWIEEHWFPKVSPTTDQASATPVPIVVVPAAASTSDTL
ncbi:hypothetical protein SAMD00019534_076250 [Acytostelium subglobosum LB1]|uniref:hypothetical protein n=1 Tax=Acytostelium subglobosum LB1 TaxID=1410327 RepID=UPI000644C95F|nr:hypothetical protein SAMD00019534_076250 [Acytostelium subglobosum LB1]GAM24450.1 hypothetical protein SAMD00019534_076250 [Acytostelium subglobosum LB1]|eukprot:XP_012752776.1 hypothetical protein SAMD00019534_076250 [Acytostelium subglobosum LB1]